VSDIRLQLHREGYNYELVQGPVLTKQLIEVMERANQREANGSHDQNKEPARKGHKSVRKEKKK
jgi:hypothetical protein